MSHWTMRFRVGNGGTSMWPLCLKHRVAAITYYPVAEVDLRKYSKRINPPHWNELERSQKYSLSSVAYEMEKGDIIYVRDKGKIIAKGEVTNKYFFDSKRRIIDDNDVPWAHQVEVDWNTDFPAVPINDIGPSMFTVYQLKDKQVEAIETAIRKTFKQVELIEAMEGELTQKEAAFRSRNRMLIQSKKATSDCKCEVCDFKFIDTYGELGRDYIVAHHLEPIGKRTKSTKTTLDDIALVCANCHAMLHRKTLQCP